MKSPYTEKDFINIVSNFKPLDVGIDPEEIIKSHTSWFTYLDKIPSSFYFIHDFINFKYILCSKSIKNVVGHDESLLIGKQFEEIMAFMHPDDVINLKEIHKEMFDFFYKQPEERRTKLRFDFNYRGRNAAGNYVQLLQQSIFPQLLNGRPYYDFSTITDISRFKKNNTLELAIYCQSADGSYDLVHQFEHSSSIPYNLSNVELKVLKEVAKGYSSLKIAETACRSIYTINNHKANILKKTNSRSLSEAISKVLVNQKEE